MGGRTLASNDILIGIPKGVTRAWTVRRRVPGERWCEEVVTRMKGIPQDWKYEADRDEDNDEMRVAGEGEAPRILAGGDPDPREGSGDREEEIRRRDPKLYLRSGEFKKLGCTPDCAGCARLNRLAYVFSHSLLTGFRMTKGWGRSSI